MKNHMAIESNQDDDDASLLEEIVSFDASNASNVKNENLDVDDGSLSCFVKDEPIDSPVMEMNAESDTGWTPRMVQKPFKWWEKNLNFFSQILVDLINFG